MKMNRNLLLTLALAASIHPLAAENLLFWDTFPIEGGVPGPTTYESTSTADGVATSTLALGPGITPRETNDPSRFQGENFNATSLAEALEIGDYFEFNLTPEAGKSVMVDGMTIVMRNRGGSTEERTIAVVSSQDDYSTVIATFDFPAGNSGDTSGPRELEVTGVNAITEETTFRIVAYFPSGFDDTKTHPLTIGWPSEDELTSTPALLVTGTVSDGSGETWNGYAVQADGWVNTGDWLGFVNIAESENWVWSETMGKYIYVPDASGWVYVPKD